MSERQPSVWVVAVGAAPPLNLSDFEDWVPFGADEKEVAARVARIESRLRAVTASFRIDEFDLVRHGESWVALSPLEARIMRVLLPRVRLVVRHEELMRAAWPDELPERERELRSLLTRLRQKVRPLAVEIHAIKGRGYLLEIDATVRDHAGGTSTPPRTA